MQNWVLYSGKIDLFQAFAQWHGVILIERLGKGVWGVKPPPEKGTGGQSPQFRIYFAMFEGYKG